MMTTSKKGTNMKRELIKEAILLDEPIDANHTDAELPNEPEKVTVKVSPDSTDEGAEQ